MVDQCAMLATWRIIEPLEVAMSYLEAKHQKEQLEAEVARRSTVLQSFPVGPMNLVPDHIKASQTFQDAKAAYNAAFNNLRAFNASFVRIYKKEIKASRRL